MSGIIQQIEKEYMKKEAPKFDVGDSVKVFVKVVEGNRERLQAFEGIVIAKKNGGVRESFTVRRISFGVGIERVFPLHSPRIDRVEVIKKGKVRRAKLYYLRNLSGKAAKIKEDIGLKKDESAEKKEKVKKAAKTAEAKPEGAETKAKISKTKQ